MKKPYLSLSLLDKLIDQKPDKNHESHKTQQQLLSDLYASIHRDLENLLNTRSLEIFQNINTQDYSFLNNSLLNYGLPDLFNNPLSLHYQTKFIQKLRSVIETFEPRLKNIELFILDNMDLTERTFRFRITGWLQLDPTPTLITLDSTLNPENYSFHLISG